MDDDTRRQIRADFARLVLAELDGDPGWERRIAHLTPWESGELQD